MPFRSEKQRRYLWATHPDIAKEWADKYPKSNKGLPMYAHENKKEKAAGINISSLISPYVNSRTLLINSILHEEPAETDKNAADKLIKVDMPHSDKPTYAGEEREEGEQKTENTDEPENGGIERRDPENAINSLLQKISVVLSQPMAQMLENRKAQQEGRNPAYQPKNPGISRYSAPTPSIPLPMGAQQPAPQAQPAQPQAQPAQPQQQRGAGMNSPSANPINSFGPISSSGNINGNAAFGIKNSPDSLKTALDKWSEKAALGMPLSRYLLRTGTFGGQVPYLALPPAIGALAGGAYGTYSAPKGKKLKSGLIGAGVGGGLGLAGSIVGDALIEPSQNLAAEVTGSGKKYRAAHKAYDDALEHNFNVRQSKPPYPDYPLEPIPSGNQHADDAAMSSYRKDTWEKIHQHEKDLAEWESGPASTLIKTGPFVDAVRAARRVNRQSKDIGFYTGYFGGAGLTAGAGALALNRFGKKKKKPETADSNAAFGIKNSPDSLKTALDKWAFSLPFGSNSKKKRRNDDDEPAILQYPRRGNSNALAGGVAAGAAALPLISLHQDAFGTYNTLRERVRGVPLDHLYFPKEMAGSGNVMHGDVATYFGEPQHIFHDKQPNTSKLTQGGEWTSGSGTYHGMLLRPFMHNGKRDVQLLEGGDAFPDKVPVTADGTKFDSPFHRFMAEQARTGKLPQETADAYLANEGMPKYDAHLQDFEHTTSKGLFNRYYNAFTNATSKNQTGDAADMKFFPRFQHYLKHYKTQGKLLDEYRKQMKPEDAAAVWDTMSERDKHFMLITRSPQMQLLLDSKHPGVADQARANVDTAFEKHYPMRSYNLGGAVSAGAKRLLFPKTAPTDQTIMADNDKLAPLPAPKCTEDYCVQPAANVLKHHGVPLGTHATTALPADLATTGASRPVGAVVPTPDLAKDNAKAYGFIPDANDPRSPDYDNPANKPLLDKWKQDYQNKVVNDWMPQSRNRRIMAGLAAAAAMGAAGYGTTKLVQSILKRRRKALAAKKRQEARAQLTSGNTAKAAAYQQSELPAFLLEYVEKVSREYPEGQAHD